MPPSPRYTIRLPEPLNTLVQEYIVSSRTPFAVLVRDALAAYLADREPTAAPTLAPTPADTLMELQSRLAALTVRVEILEGSAPTYLPTGADSADTLREHEEQLAALATRVQIVELALAAVPTPADTAPTEEPTGADTPSSRRTGRQPSPERQRIISLLAAHPEGLTGEQLRASMPGTRPLGDVLSGMRRTGAIRTEGRGHQTRYFLPEKPPGR